MFSWLSTSFKLSLNFSFYLHFFLRVQCFAHQGHHVCEESIRNLHYSHKLEINSVLCHTKHLNVVVSVVVMWNQMDLLHFRVSIHQWAKTFQKHYSTWDFHLQKTSSTGKHSWGPDGRQLNLSAKGTLKYLTWLMRCSRSSLSFLCLVPVCVCMCLWACKLQGLANWHQISHLLPWLTFQFVRPPTAASLGHRLPHFGRNVCRWPQLRLLRLGSCHSQSRITIESKHMDVSLKQNHIGTWHYYNWSPTVLACKNLWCFRWKSFCHKCVQLWTHLTGRTAISGSLCCSWGLDSQKKSSLQSNTPLTGHWVALYWKVCQCITSMMGDTTLVLWRHHSELPKFK